MMYFKYHKGSKNIVQINGRSMLNCLPCVPTSQHTLRAYVLTCQRALHAYVLMRQRALRVYVFLCLHVLCTYMLTC